MILGDENYDSNIGTSTEALGHLEIKTVLAESIILMKTTLLLLEFTNVQLCVFIDARQIDQENKYTNEFIFSLSFVTQ